MQNAFSAIGPLGTLTVRLFGDDITLTGGPYACRPANMVGIKMAEEIRSPCDIDIGTRDFDVPNREKLFQGILHAMTAHFLRGQPLYVGCMAGRGRTGLFLASLAHLCGEQDPVRFVRSNYYEHAVETARQEQFVFSLDRDEFRRVLLKVLHSYGAINFTRLRKMNWRDRLDFLKVLVGR